MICRQCFIDKEVNLFAKNRRKCRQCISFNNMIWQKNNPLRVEFTQKSYIENNVDKIKKQNQEWYQVNKVRLAKKFQDEKETIYAQRTEARKDILVRLKISLRNRLYSAIKNNSKRGSAIKDLGCTVEELKVYLESKFQSGMSWDNYGFYGWHIDHIKPLALASSGEELFSLCRYNNLQPLWAADNFKKGVNYDDQSY